MVTKNGVLSQLLSLIAYSIILEGAVPARVYEWK